jgi:hypothetical protein
MPLSQRIDPPGPGHSPSPVHEGRHTPLRAKTPTLQSVAELSAASTHVDDDRPAQSLGLPQLFVHTPQWHEVSPVQSES